MTKQKNKCIRDFNYGVKFEMWENNQLIIIRLGLTLWIIKQTVLRIINQIK